MSAEGIAVDPAKVSAVTEWESTKSAKDIRSFLGLAGYYRRFIENFSKIAKPMTELLKKEKKFAWTEECEDSFQELKQRLVTAPVLCLPDLQKDFQVYCDASRQGLGDTFGMFFLSILFPLFLFYVFLSVTSSVFVVIFCSLSFLFFFVFTLSLLLLFHLLFSPSAFSISHSYSLLSLFIFFTSFLISGVSAYNPAKIGGKG